MVIAHEGDVKDPTRQQENVKRDDGRGKCAFFADVLRGALYRQCGHPDSSL